MNADRLQLLMLRGAIAELPESDQVKLRECREKLAAVVQEYKEAGQTALCLLIAELAAGELK